MFAPKLIDICMLYSRKCLFFNVPAEGGNLRIYVQVQG